MIKLNKWTFFKIIGKILERVSSRIYWNSTDSIIKEKSAYKLVYFAGNNSISYLNASLISVQRNWKTIPEIVIISDGTTERIFMERLVTWPQKIEIINWKICADYYYRKGNAELSKYAKNELWGKKFVGIMYCFERWQSLYCDTDVLWFNDPSNSISKTTIPYIKMSKDIESCYSVNMLQSLNEESLKETPLNAGVIFGQGDFSSYDKWDQLCKYLNDKADNRTEQTSFAILTKNMGESWKSSEIYMNISDAKFYPYNTSLYQNILARHYVNLKEWLFWRDYFLFILKKQK